MHVLVSDTDALAGIRTRIRTEGHYGRISAQRWQGGALPYADGTVNFLFAPNRSKLPSPAEVDRVLAPRGTAWINRGGQLTLLRKPAPGDIDGWTHARYDASGNAVSGDRQSLQWEALPRWNRGTKTSNMVSTKGRIFYIFSAPKSSDIPLDRTVSELLRQARAGKHAIDFHWWKRVPIMAWGMLKAGDHLFLAGPRGEGLPSQAALDGKTKASLLVLSAETGETTAEFPLPAAPVWDGMAAANGALFLSLANGEVTCLKNASPE